MSAELECGQCGKRLRVRPEWAGKKAKCPACGAVSVVPVAGTALGTAIRPADSPGEVLVVAPLDDAPLDVVPLQPEPDAGKKPAPGKGAAGTCPECGTSMAADAVICLDCGFNRKTGKQLKTVSKRIERTWYLGGLFEPSVIVVFVLVVLVMATVAFLSTSLTAGAEEVQGVAHGGNTSTDQGEYIVVAAVLVVAGIVLGALLLLGNFTRIRITRDRGGKPLLYRDRWLFFIPAGRKTLDLDDYQLIKLGHKGGGANPSVVALLLCLILCGLLPGLIFYFLQFRGSTFTLEVAGEHEGGYAPDVEPEVLYRGPSEAKMRSIGDALKEIAELRYG
jgi:hypothetical protein